ncbi:LLM class flavin-dependent oxidoreductase [Bradyrhizobium sp. 2]|jgi:alkanesulfonate monooxygenase SsuD/methylene tetrahydromethanopterin reductase-like flavin-dependent oxidoreductase (luciferase family)|uniref:LLM class flavin-dependent oxidoreductase n=1 Tax=Bradyrhizobium sp. 2 TaxID=190045 RepID=UPI001FF98553|nr:LLM class flavin-dependent oxidoreductase [Bradyrhizobium sp. 2]MCK1459677.1 LLM class flavin-dependent oxidoreductase [Bradyrhizobium sp. 2]
MEFGVFILAQQRGYHQTSQQVINNAVEQTVAAEAAGFDTAWYAEHHFNNYSLCPSPLMMVAHCAGLTKRIRLGTAVCVLPLYHPARLLGEIGFADTVSNGRLDLGIGSGYQQFEFDRFGVDLKNSHSLFAELYDVLEAGMKEHVFSYSGQHLQIPPTSIAVRTVQKPMPPIWVTSGHAETLGRAIRDNHNLFVTALLNGLDAIKALRERLEGIAAKEGRSIDDTRFGFLRCAYASDNDSEVTSYLDNARFQRRLSESLKFRRAQSDDGYLIKEEAGPNDMSLETMRSNLPVGSVNQVIDRMLEEISILKPTHIAVQTQLGDFDQRTMLRQIELWGSKIIPAIRKELTSATAGRGKIAGEAVSA